MSGEKTEKPTPRRLAKARKEGQVAKSQDLNAAFMLGGGGAMLLAGGVYGSSILRGLMTDLLGRPYTGNWNEEDFLVTIESAFHEMLLILLPLFAALCVVAIAINLIQVKPLLTFHPLQPKLSKINPVQGVKKLFSMRSVVEALKAILKMSIVGAIGYAVISSHIEELLTLGFTEPALAAERIVSTSVELIFWCFMAYLVTGVADFLYQDYEHKKKLRMSKQDIKDEHKNLQGDPQMKGKIRQMGRSFVQKQQIQKVPTADVIITNPTHYAIAVRYDPDVAPAPHVVASGVDHFALKIREVAKEHGVMMVENRPLARSLYAAVEPGEMIPPELFVAVAEVLAFVYSKSKKRPKPLR